MESSLDTNLTRNTRAPHFTPQHWLMCHMGLYYFEFEFVLGITAGLEDASRRGEGANARAAKKHAGTARDGHVAT